jgi:hypothetical protein
MSACEPKADLRFRPIWRVGTSGFGKSGHSGSVSFVSESSEDLKTLFCAVSAHIATHSATQSKKDGAIVTELYDL